MHCVTTEYLKEHLLCHVKYILKESMWYFSYKLGYNRTLDASIWWQKYFPNGHSNEVYQHKINGTRKQKKGSNR